MYNIVVNEFRQCPTEGAIGLLALLIKSGRLAESRLDDALASVDLTFVKWRTLDALVKAESPIPLGLLAERLSCVKSNVTQLVDKLEVEGAVQRASDREDRRSILVDLTDKGQWLHGAGRQALELATQALFHSFGDEDRAVLRQLLNALEGD
jgi:DNA-binding MarR family transcriptional regulator